MAFSSESCEADVEEALAAANASWMAEMASRDASCDARIEELLTQTQAQQTECAGGQSGRDFSCWNGNENFATCSVMYGGFWYATIDGAPPRGPDPSGYLDDPEYGCTLTPTMLPDGWELVPGIMYGAGWSDETSEFITTEDFGDGSDFIEWFSQVVGTYLDIHWGSASCVVLGNGFAYSTGSSLSDLTMFAEDVVWMPEYAVPYISETCVSFAGGSSPGLVNFQPGFPSQLTQTDCTSYSATSCEVEGEYGGKRILIRRPV